MKKNLATLGLTVCSLALIQATQVSAEEVASYQTNGTITFEADDSITPPVDPVNPEKPVTPIDPSKPDDKPTEGTGGPLSIDFASSFIFGSHKITTETMDYYAGLQTFQDSEDGPNYIQITDKRGTQEGWTVSVKQNGQFETRNGDILEGAELSLSAGTTTSVTDQKYSPRATLKREVTLSPNGFHYILVSANRGQGMGTWIYKFGNDAEEGRTAVKLNVPGKTVKLAQEYSTTITWTLSNIPTVTYES